MILSDIKARQLAEDYLSRQDLKGFRYEFVMIKHNEQRPDVLGVVFNVFTSEGSIIDGPAIFLVDKETKEVTVL